MRVVVVGNGMVGARFVEELVRSHPSAQVTVLGREVHEPYNRVLLSSVVAGTTSPEALAIGGSQSDRVRTLSGVAATRVHRAAKTVVDTRGEVHEYDALVLATGSQARIPRIQGVATGQALLPGVSVLKDLDDCTRIVKSLRKARRAVVLGAGVLGLEVATGLAARGLAVTVVHQGERLMERQLGAAAARVATSALSRLGVKVITEASVARTVDRRGALSAVTLTDGSEVLTDLLVMCAGTIPDTVLAQDSGLPCERGIVVNDSLASPADPDVYAIGDCAQPPEGGTGLVAQGWEQAARLAAQLTADARVQEPSRPTTELAAPGGGATDVVRVKASGLEVVAMGVSGQFDNEVPGLRTVRMSDPAIGRFVEVVVSQGLLVGATVVGDTHCASDLTAMYTRMLPVPTDPAHLIVRPLAQAAGVVAASAAQMQPSDTVCHCNSVSKERIDGAISAGCATVADIARDTRATTGCGDCRSLVKDLIEAGRDNAGDGPASDEDQTTGTEVSVLAGN